MDSSEFQPPRIFLSSSLPLIPNLFKPLFTREACAGFFVYCTRFRIPNAIPDLVQNFKIAKKEPAPYFGKDRLLSGSYNIEGLI